MKHSFFPKTAALLLLWLFPSLIFAESVTYTVIKDDDLGTVINGFGQNPKIRMSILRTSLATLLATVTANNQKQRNPFWNCGGRLHH